MFIRKVIEVAGIYLDWGNGLFVWSWRKLDISHTACFPNETSKMSYLLSPQRGTCNFFPCSFLEWCCGMPKDILSPSQLLPRLPSGAHCWPVLQGLPT